MVVVALLAIRCWQKSQLILASILLGIAVNIKMSALLMLPGFFLTVAIEGGIGRVIISLLIIIGLQFLIGLEFIMSNSNAYFSMSYNFERVFLKVEQVNFQFLSQEFMHSKEFNTFLLAMHILFLVVFLLFKWTTLAPMEFFKQIKLYPFELNFGKNEAMCQYKKLLIILTSNFIGICFSRGTH